MEEVLSKFVKGMESPNPSGRPPGSKTSVKLSLAGQRTVIRQLESRAKDGDVSAVDLLGLLIVQGGGIPVDAK